MRLNLKYEFPCGYKISLEFKGFAIISKLDILDQKDICPIHKNKCRKEVLNIKK